MSHFFILGWTARTISQNDFAEKCLVRLLGRAASMYSQCCLAHQSEGYLRVVTARMVLQICSAGVVSQDDVAGPSEWNLQVEFC